MYKFRYTQAALIGIASFYSLSAQASDLSVSTSIDYVSEYIFRGVSFAQNAVQPGIEISKGGFTAGVWSSVAIGDDSNIAGDEIDLYAGYSWSLSENINADVGATLYHFPDTDGSLFDFGGASSLEIYGGLGFDTALSPSLTAYYDLDLEAFTLEGAVSHSIPMAEKTSLDMGLTVGLVSIENATDYEYGLGSAALSYAVSDNVSAYIGANYSLASENTLKFRASGAGAVAATTKNDLLWFGVGVATSF